MRYRTNNECGARTVMYWFDQSYDHLLTDNIDMDSITKMVEGPLTSYNIDDNNIDDELITDKMDWSPSSTTKRK